MVIKPWYVEIWQEVLKPYLIAVGLLAWIACIGGCLGTGEEKDHAAITPQPITGTSMIILDDGQSAMLLEDVIAKAVVPYNGDPLYQGEVRFQKGSLVVKPRVEGHR